MGSGDQGWAFWRKNGTRAKASDYRKIIFTELEQIQDKRPNLIDPSNWCEYEVKSNVFWSKIELDFKYVLHELD